MSDRPQLNTPGRGRQSPQKIHEDVLAFFRQIVREEIEPRLPTMATVTGRDGGKLKLHYDDEDQARDDGVPRKLGNRYNSGDRVTVGFTRSGKPFVMGVVSVADDKSGAERVVDNPDLATDSVDQRAIQKNSVRGSKGGNQNSHIQSGTIVGGDIDDRSISGGKLAKNTVGTDELNTGLVSKVNGALQPSDVQGSGKVASVGYVDGKVPNLSSYAKSSDLTQLEKDIHKWVSDNFAKK